MQKYSINTNSVNPSTISHLVVYKMKNEGVITTYSFQNIEGTPWKVFCFQLVQVIWIREKEKPQKCTWNPNQHSDLETQGELWAWILPQQVKVLWNITSCFIALWNITDVHIKTCPREVKKATCAIGRPCGIYSDLNMSIHIINGILPRRYSFFFKWWLSLLCNNLYKWNQYTTNVALTGTNVKIPKL